MHGGRSGGNRRWGRRGAIVTEMLLSIGYISHRCREGGGLENGGLIGHSHQLK